MFNQNSTSSERRAFLMAILDTENDEDEVIHVQCSSVCNVHVGTKLVVCDLHVK